MPTLDRYTITETLHEGAAVALYRGVRTHDGCPVLIKALRGQSPAPRALERLRHEYAIGCQLDSPAALRPYALETDQSRLLLIVEDTGGQPLAHVLGPPLDVDRFLAIAIPLADALADIHHQRIVHKDIKPANILLHPHSGAVRLCNFSIAAPPTPVPLTPVSASLIEGSLAYMSPEQTGRMNRAIDYRSDLYSLGVTFYQMLTGVLPFAAADPLEWVHCHIARRPPSPRQLLPTLPEPLAAIVLKLLAKQAEHRYQSARGLRLDLERCQAQWQALGQIEPFSLGEHDVCELFVMPQKLYGREPQVAGLLRAFGQVQTAGQPALVLVAGDAGIGKSALIRELHQPVVRARGWFISGKFDQQQRDIPYATIGLAFGDLVQQLLTASDDQIGRWKARLLKALAGNGQLLIDLLPQLALVIGSQPPVPELPPTEAQHRFVRVFAQFVGVFAQPHQPLVLFLDDMQWLDLASLRLLAELLSQPETGELLVIGAYRSNEVSQSHPLGLLLAEVGKQQVAVQELGLGPLTLEQLEQLVADTVHREATVVEPLAQLVYTKTAGNPFFVQQFLTTLHQAGLLSYDPHTADWRWDIEAIGQQGYTDNVVELLVGTLTRLAAGTQALLMQAACLGHTVEVGVLALMAGRSEAELHAELWEAVSAGLLLRGERGYEFVHDRVQEAAYGLLEEGQRVGEHLRIGRLLLAHTPEQRLAEKSFAIVSQLNRGLGLITDPEERGRVAALNLHAGRKAKASIAYASACTFLAAGAALLGEERWKSDYELAITLCLEQAECEYLRGSFAEAERCLALALFHAKVRADKAAAYRLCIELYTINGEVERAVDTMLECAALFGLALERHPSAETVKEQYARVMQRLGDHSIEDLIRLPPMSDRDVRALIEALMAASPPVTNYDDCLHFAIVSETVRLSIQYGSAPCSVVAYAYFGTMIGSLLGNYRDGYRFGKLSYDLVERDGLVAYKARSCAMFAYGIVPWIHHVSTALPYLEEGLRAGAAAGDPVFACYCCCCIVSVLLAGGDSLNDVDRESARMLDFVRNARYDDVEDNLLIQRRLILRLRSLTSPLALADDLPVDDEGLDVRILSRIPTVVCWYYIRKLQERFLFGDYQEALFASVKAKEVLWTSTHHWESCEYSYFLALTLSALYAEASSHDQEEYLRALWAERERCRVWAENCPENFLNRYALVAAEIARIEGQVLEAEQLYEQAIGSAHEHDFVQNEALAYELAATFYRTRGFDTIADTYLREARACYLRWGAEGKVQQLDQHYPHLLNNQPLAPTTTIAARSDQLDLLAVIKASQAISGQIRLPELQQTLLRIVLQQAGAQRGTLLLTDGDQLAIHAQASLVGTELRVTLTPKLPLSATMLPLSLISYVKRTAEAVLLADAATDDRFASDPYITRQQPRSVLGLPILRQSQLVGLLYLENTLMAGAFSPTTLTVVELLAAQSAVSLETALLYANLQHENTQRQQAEAKYRSIFEHAAEGIFQTSPAGTMLTANPAMAQMLGYETPAALLAAISDIGTQLYVAPQRRAELLQMLETHETVQHFEAEFYRKDRSRIWVSSNIRAVRDDHGNVRYYEGLCEDISERKRAETALRESERGMQEAQHLARIGNWEWDMASDTFTLSDELCLITGRDRTHPRSLYRSQTEAFLPEDAARLRQAVQNSLQTGQPYALDLVLRHASGTLKWVTARGEAKRAADGTVVGLRGTVQDISERKRAEAELRRSEERYRDLYDNAPDGYCVVDAAGRFKEINATQLDWLGYQLHELIGQLGLQDVLLAEGRYEVSHLLDWCQRDGQLEAVEQTLIGRAGKQVPVRLNMRAIRDARGHTTGYRLTMREIAKEKQLEAQLLQAQKLESLGTLVGGIAHDFNNMLTGILGFAELALHTVAAESQIYDDLSAIELLSRRAAEMVKQLLAFSRRSESHTSCLSLGRFLEEITGLLGRIIPETIGVDLHLAAEELLVDADPAQLQQVMMNLVVNARDAMPEGGRLVIETALVELDTAFCQTRPDLEPGRYARLRVSDTGVGIPQAIRSRIFDPFFTTKGVGQGTGLGLPVVYGIVINHGGAIEVESQVGQGTTVTVYLPLSAERVEEQATALDELVMGSETLLLVEDEPLVLAFGRTALERCGYRVLTAEDGVAALEVFAAHRDEIALVILDVVMPRMGGRAAGQLKRLKPRVAVLLTTGYANLERADQQVGEEQAYAVLHKPYQIRQLAQAVRAVLEHP